MHREQLETPEHKNNTTTYTGYYLIPRARTYLNLASCSRILCYHQACDPMTCPINSIVDNRQLGRQVGGVIKISPSSLMAPFSINAVTFIPGEEFTFGSFNFVAGTDGR